MKKTGFNTHLPTGAGGVILMLGILVVLSVTFGFTLGWNWAEGMFVVGFLVIISQIIIWLLGARGAAIAVGVLATLVAVATLWGMLQAKYDGLRQPSLTGQVGEEFH